MRPLLHLAGSVAWMITSAALCAQSPKPTELMPATTVLYAEGTDSQTVLQLPLVENLVQSALFRELWKTPDAMKLRGGITLAEVALGERLPEALGKLTAQGWTVGVDGRSQGVVLWTHARDVATCEELYKKLLYIAENDAKSKGRELKQTTYREIDAYEVNGAVVARLEDYLVVCNKGELAKGLVDRWREPPAKTDTLAGNQRFQEFASQTTLDSSAKATRLARVWLDLQQIKDAGMAKKIFAGPHDNFPAELFLGGVIAVLRGAPTLHACLDSEDQRLQLRVSAPFSQESVGGKYDYFFGEKATGQAPARIMLGTSQASVCLYRNLAQLWQRAGDIFGQKTNDQLAQAETTLTTLFSGRDFASEILGAIHPELQLIVTEQEFGKRNAPIPQVKLPAFALVTRLRDPQVMQPQMKRIFMSLIGFANVAGAMNQQPQLDLEAFRLESGWEVTASYAVDADRPKDWIVPVQYNFSPTLLLMGDHVVIASTQAVAQAIGEQLKSPAATPVATTNAHLNSMIYLDGDLLNKSLSANRQQLISQNMIEKGHSQEEAAAEIELLLSIVKLVKSVEVALTVGSHAGLEVKLEVAQTPAR